MSRAKYTCYESCAYKVGHDCKADAKVHADRVQNSTLYYCKGCRKWYVGRKKVNPPYRHANTENKHKG